ncbi:MAG: phage Gp37/Gp68 family protein, partial [Elusimicrobiota bacterium]|nr:phage Gp37/Gp68 family protein [Elusimicrobiota bacterium]
NVNLGWTVENQELANKRLPLFLSYPIKRRFIACSPLLGPIDLSAYLHGAEHVTVSGESGREARLCDYNWVLDLRRQAAAAGVSFSYHQTGARLLKDGKIYRIPKKLQRAQAKKANIDFDGQ